MWQPEEGGGGGKGHWADLRRVGSHGAPLAPGGAAGADPPAEEQAEALAAEEGGAGLEGGAALAAPRHAAAWRAAAGGRAQRSGATLLCAHVDFRAALAALPALSPLCEGAEAM